MIEDEERKNNDTSSTYVDTLLLPLLPQLLPKDISKT